MVSHSVTYFPRAFLSLSFLTIQTCVPLNSCDPDLHNGRDPLQYKLSDVDPDLLNGRDRTIRSSCRDRIGFLQNMLCAALIYTQ